MKKPLKRLIIDTATQFLYVALYEGEQPIDVVYERGQNNHSVTLMPTIEALFDRLTYTIKEVDEIVVGVGPGSYTGVRIGVVVAKMFAWTLEKPLYTISSLALIASSVKNSRVLPYQDARRGNAFLGLYQNDGVKLKRLIEDQHAALDAFVAAHQPQSTSSKGKPDFAIILNSDLMTKADAIHHVSPVYLRKTEAERNLSND